MKKAVKAILNVLSYGGIEVESAVGLPISRSWIRSVFFAKIGYGNI